MSKEHFTKDANRRRFCVVLCVIGVVLLLTALVIGLYFGISAKSNTTSTGTTLPVTGVSKPESTVTLAAKTTTTAKTTNAVFPTTTPATATITTTFAVPQTTLTTTSSSATRPTTTNITTAVSQTTLTSKPVVEVMYSVILTLDQQYNRDLDDSDNPAYISLKNDIETMINGIMRNSELGESFVGSSLTGFREGSTYAIIRTDFKSTHVLIGDKKTILDEILVANVVVNGLKSNKTDIHQLNINVNQTVVQLYLEVELNEEGCRKVWDCVTAGAVCASGVCLCPSTHFYNSSQCVGRQGIGMQTNFMIKLNINDTDALATTDLTYIRVGFMTKIKQGVFLQIQDTTRTQYILLEMNTRGGVRLVINVGFIRYEINTLVQSDFADGQAHEVTVRRNDNTSVISLQVDSNNPVIVTFHLYYNSSGSSILDDHRYLFIGRNETSVNGFQGCIYSIQIDDVFNLQRLLQVPRPNDIEFVPDNGEIRLDVCH